MPLNDKLLKNIKPTIKRYEIADSGGLSIRVSPNGNITFQYRFRIEGKQFRMDFGSYPDISLAETRELHRLARNEVSLGKNPIEEKKERTLQDKQAITVADLVDEFMAKEIRGRLKRKRPDYADSILRNQIIPTLGQKKAKDVSRRDVIDLLEKIVSRGAPVMANRTGSLTKQMFTFAQARGWIEVSPCANLTKSSIGGSEKPRDTFLSYQQIWKLWHGLPKASFNESLKVCLKILLATGQRRGEIILGEWSHISFEKGRWTIPAFLSKNGKEHIIQLTPLTSSLFMQLKELAGASRYMVPSPVSQDDAPISERAINHAITRSKDIFGIENLTPHVLRHTFSTKLSGLGVAPHVIEKLLNHQLGGMLAVYNHHPYYKERKEALHLWSETLVDICSAKDIASVMAEPDLIEAAESI
ncbi:MAG: tyrosine-type recombinase/integrase [Nitrosomonas sp.]|nr:tyrosine-type recombinase/integrase [Nitrosomonas sp.]UJP00111.1 MAG: tyrosine-type recombinase/integrase [Nitrosomonas sp.]